MAAAASPLTTTSYAILGLLAVRPWTTYELAQQMGRAMGQFWPRAESKLYEEPKKLVAHRLATASKESVGKRPRTVYRITAKGRRALAAWVSVPPQGEAGPVVEFEPLVRVFFAEHGSKQDLLATIASVQAWTATRAAIGAAICREYLRGEGLFPPRLPWLILTGQFLDELDHAVARWADWAQDTVEGWPDDVRDAEPDWATLEAMATRNEEHLRRARRRRSSASRP
ncbi:MAG: PadR family transcriptional regulator [Acidimicrobiales bacterium]